VQLHVDFFEDEEDLVKNEGELQCRRCI
jgi:hypothetical protein